VRIKILTFQNNNKNIPTKHGIAHYLEKPPTKTHRKKKSHTSKNILKLVNTTQCNSLFFYLKRERERCKWCTATDSPSWAAIGGGEHPLCRADCMLFIDHPYVYRYDTITLKTPTHTVQIKLTTRRLRKKYQNIGLRVMLYNFNKKMRNEFCIV
jgi:hypothetical protein